MLSGNLRDMKQGIDTGLQLYKRAKIGHSCDLACDNRADCILLCCANPRILIRELQGKSNLLALDILHENSQLLANLEDLLRILDSAPAHLADMEKTVSTAEIDERAEVGDILHRALDNIAHLQRGEQLFLLLCSLRNQELLAVTDISSSVRIVLNDHKTDLLILILCEILLIRIGNQGSGDKHADALYIDGKSAIEHLYDLGSEDFLVVVGLLNPLVAAVSSQPLVGKNDLSVSVVHLEDLDLERIARVKNSREIDRIIIGVFAASQNTV